MESDGRILIENTWNRMRHWDTFPLCISLYGRRTFIRWRYNQIFSAWWVTNSPYQWCIAGVLRVLKSSFDKARRLTRTSRICIFMIYDLLHFTGQDFTAAQRERAQEDFKVLFKGAPPHPPSHSHTKDSHITGITLTTKTSNLHGLHARFAFLYISYLFSSFRCRDMTCFAVVWTTWAHDNKVLLSSYLWIPGCRFCDA